MAAASVYGRGRIGEDWDGVGAQRYADGDCCGADQHRASDIDVGGGVADGERCAGTVVYFAGVFSLDREACSQEREIPAYCLTKLSMSYRDFWATACGELSRLDGAGTESLA